MKYNEANIDDVYHSLLVQYENNLDNGNEASAFYVDPLHDEIGTSVDETDSVNLSWEEIYNKVNECSYLTKNQRYELALR